MKSFSISLTGILLGILAPIVTGRQSYHHPNHAHGHIQSIHSPNYPGQFTPDPRKLAELYSAALVEGGQLMLYSGEIGETGIAKAVFETRFPGMNISIVADLSKNHDARIQHQLETDTLVPDVIQFRALHAFTRWRNQGVLLPYKGIGWDKVYPEFKDPDGHFTGVRISAFSNNINRNYLGDDESTWPTEFVDYLRPEFKERIVSTWPNDEDAVLYQYSVIIAKYGWDWLQGFMKNRPVFVRSTRAPWVLVENGSFPATFTTAGALSPQLTRPVQFILPKTDPFVCWARTVAIFKGTKRPEASKLYLSWLLDVETQMRALQWSVRRDVPIPTGFRSIFDYPLQADPLGFNKFLENRTALEIFRGRVQLYVGEVEGTNPAGDLGLHPK